MATLKEGNVLFNNTLKTFYLQLYGVRHMVKDHTDNKRKTPLLPHRLLLPINSKGSFITDRITHTTTFVTPVVEHWLKREIAQWGSWRDKDVVVKVNNERRKDMFYLTTHSTHFIYGYMTLYRQ